MRIRGLICACFAVMQFQALGFLSSAQAQPQGQPPSKVRVDAVRREPVRNTLPVTGSLRAVSESRVAAQEEGALVSVNVDEADAVRGGDVLAKIDDRRLRAQLAEAEGELRVSSSQAEALGAELENARRNLARLQPLLKDGMTTEKNVTDAETAVRVAEANLRAEERNSERIRSRIDLLKIRLSDTVTRAPFDGWVVERNAEPGEWIRPGDPLVRLISSGSIEAWLEVPERYFKDTEAILPELSAAVEIGDCRMRSTGARLIPRVNPSTRTFFIIATLDASDHPLAPGASAKGWIPLGGMEERLTVHKDAVIKDGAGFMVYKVQTGDGGAQTAVPVNVQKRFETENRFVIEDNPELSDGALVVIEGNERLRPMAPVSVIR